MTSHVLTLPRQHGASGYYLDQDREVNTGQFLSCLGYPLIGILFGCGHAALWIVLLNEDGTPAWFDEHLGGGYRMRHFKNHDDKRNFFNWQFFQLQKSN